MSFLARRVLIATGVLMGAGAIVSPTALADTVNLSGEVSSTAAVTSTATGNATALNLGGDGTDLAEQIVQVADVDLTTNNSTGLTATITSGNLSNGTATDDIAFKVQTVGDGATAPVSGDFTTASGTDLTYANSAAGDDPRDLYIAYDPAALQDPGTYTGSITLTVADN